MLRITSSMITDSLVSQLTRLSQRQAQLQSQAATGLRVQYPEDDPTSMRRILDMQAEARTVGQYQTNIARLKDQATSSYTVMTALKKISDRVTEIATLADGTKSQQELNIYATEVTELIKQAAQLTNSKYQGDYLFGGTLSDQPPFVLATDGNGLVTSVTYQGNTSVASAEVAEGVTLSAQTLGANTSGTGPRGLITDTRSGADFFNHLISLQNNLLAGNTAAIASTDMPGLLNDENNIIFQIASNSSIQARMETATSIAKNRSASLESLISREADADLADTLVRLNEAQNAYTAALQSGARVLNLSLLDYLR